MRDLPHWVCVNQGADAVAFVRDRVLNFLRSQLSSIQLVFILLGCLSAAFASEQARNLDEIEIRPIRPSSGGNGRLEDAVERIGRLSMLLQVRLASHGSALKVRLGSDLSLSGSDG